MKSIRSACNDGHFDCIVDTACNVQGTWALILALIQILTCKLKFSPQRRFEVLSTEIWLYDTGQIVMYRADIAID